MRFHFDKRKSKQRRANPKRGIGFEEAQEIFSHAYPLNNVLTYQSSTERSVGWEKGCTRLYLRCVKTRKENTGTL
jgi:uncharacterized DUF497 family protein